MVNQTKQYEVDNIQALVNDAKSVALVDYQGINAEQLRKLRKEVAEAGGNFYVTKNTLIAIALEKLGIKLESPLEGPTALVLSNEDAVNALKAVDKTREELEKPEFKLGILENKLLSLEKLEELVKLPTKQELLAKFVGGLSNPLQRLAYAMRFNQTKLTLVLKAIAEKAEN